MSKLTIDEFLIIQAKYEAYAQGVINTLKAKGVIVMDNSQSEKLIMSAFARGSKPFEAVQSVVEYIKSCKV